MKCFNFTKTEYEYICEECMLNEDYKELLKMEIKDYSRVKMAQELNVSTDTLDKMIANLKKKIKKILWKLIKTIKRTLQNNVLFLLFN